MLWIGPALGAIERACMRSVLRCGHPLTLWCYRRPDGAPAGVEFADAAALIPEREVIRHHTGSVSLFSNRFRYALQAAEFGIWLDCDAYLFAPLPEKEYLFGEMEPGRINGGVLRLPADSPILPPLLALFEERTVPAWLPLRARLAARWRLATTGKTGLSQMPWGVAGPEALTALAHRHGLMHRALLPEALYPARWEDAAWIRDPSIPVERIAGPRTLSVHLWNERIKTFKNEPAPPGSFLARLQREGA